VVVAIVMHRQTDASNQEMSNKLIKQKVAQSQQIEPPIFFMARKIPLRLDI
jgi:hypothetical protein